jgi:prevent-host-death family protein
MNRLSSREAAGSNIWQLYDAKNQLSRVVERAAIEPQVITVRGREEAVVVSWQDWTETVKPKKSFTQALQELNDEDGGLTDEEYKEFLNNCCGDRKNMVERGTPFVFD